MTSINVLKELDKEVGIRDNQVIGVPYYLDKYEGIENKTLYVSFNVKSKLYKATYWDMYNKIWDRYENEYHVHIRIDILGINMKPRKIYVRRTATISPINSLITLKTTLEEANLKERFLEGTHETEKELAAHFTHLVTQCQLKELPKKEVMLNRLTKLINSSPNYDIQT